MSATDENHAPFVACETCAGLFGQIEIPDPRPDDPYYCRVISCPDCNGTGWVSALVSRRT